MKAIYSSLIIALILVGCSEKNMEIESSPGIEASAQEGDKSSPVGSWHLVDGPASAVQGTLPDGWAVLKVEEKTHPPYRPEAEGRAIFMGVTGKNYPKIPYEAALYIMPSDYQDGGEDPTGGRAMTWPARLIATTADAKVYLWQSSRSYELEEDLREALLK